MALNQKKKYLDEKTEHTAGRVGLHLKLSFLNSDWTVPLTLQRFKELEVLNIQRRDFH